MTKPKAQFCKVAVVDDDLEMGRVVKDLLTEEGYEVFQFLSAGEALVKFKVWQAQNDLPQIVITDHRMKEIDGIMFLKKLQSDYPDIVTLMMTAFGSIETAIEAMKSGAYHYIVKPFKNEEMILQVRRAAEKSNLQKENQILRQELYKTNSLDTIVGKSNAMAGLFELIRLVASASASVLITGESGSGKELVARALHNSGARQKKPFIPLNCTAIPEQLLESELFGHTKGSFTGAVTDRKGLFEEANGGTLFLDEIGDLSLQLQAKLLRVLQDKQVRPVGSSHFKTVDVRIIAATHRDLQAMVKTEKFREDLFYRLNVIPIKVPALRERRDDIPLLVTNFINKFSVRNQTNKKSITPSAMALLMAHSWPGNVRELENIVERAMVLSPGDTIGDSVIFGGVAEEAEKNVEKMMADRPTLEQLEERYIKSVLTETQDKKEEATRILGISRRTLYRKEKAYGLIQEDAKEMDWVENEINA